MQRRPDCGQSGFAGALSLVVAPLLEKPCFVMCGASFVVNLEHVEAVRKDGAVMKNGEELHLPKKACVPLKAAWLNYWLEEEA